MFVLSRQQIAIFVTIFSVFSLFFIGISLKITYIQFNPSVPSKNTPPGPSPHPERIDVVYTWVNGSDPSFLEEMRTHNPPNNTQTNRFREYNNLYYSVLLLNKFAPFIHTIHIVTNGQIADWYTPEQFPKIRWVFHSKIFRNASNLPNFNSLVIESNLHRVPDLAEHYVYFNDDVVLLRKASREDFFIRGVPVVRLQRIPRFHCEDRYNCVVRHSHELLERHGLANELRLYIPAHTGHASRKSVMWALDRRFSTEFHEMERNSTFRTENDYNIDYMSYVVTFSEVYYSFDVGLYVSLGGAEEPMRAFLDEHIFSLPALERPLYGCFNDNMSKWSEKRMKRIFVEAMERLLAI